MKLCHLHLKDGYGNPSTLICSLKEGSIDYTYYSGWGSSGMGLSLSNLQCTLPMDKIHEKETKDEFVTRVINTINNDSVKRVIKLVTTQITF